MMLPFLHVPATACLDGIRVVQPILDVCVCLWPCPSQQAVGGASVSALAVSTGHLVSTGYQSLLLRKQGVKVTQGKALRFVFPVFGQFSGN